MTGSDLAKENLLKLNLGNEASRFRYLHLYDARKSSRTESNVRLRRNDALYSVATLFELYGGLVASKPQYLAEKQRKLDEFRDLVRMADFGPEEAHEAAKIKAELKGRGIGPYDLLIAATARTHGWTLATSNVKEFSRVKNLRVEDWNSQGGAKG